MLYMQFSLKSWERWVMPDIVQKNMLIEEGKTYKEVQKMKGCWAKMISNALKWKAKPERKM